MSNPNEESDSSDHSRNQPQHTHADLQRELARLQVALTAAEQINQDSTRARNGGNNGQPQPQHAAAAQPAAAQPVAAAPAPAPIAVAPDNGTNHQEVAIELTFTGWDKAPGSSSAQDFIGDLRSRKARYRWIDTNAVQHAITSMKGEASVWVHASLKIVLTKANYQRLLTDFDYFAETFCAAYHIKDQRTAFYSEDLQPQRQGESAVKYMNRITAAFSAGVETASVAQIQFDEIPPGVTPELKQWLDAQLAICKDAMARNLTTELMRFLIRDGLMDKRLRQLATDNLTKPVDEYIKLISNREFNMSSLSFADKNKRTTEAARRTINAVATDDEEQYEEVDAVKKKKKNKKAGKGKNFEKKKTSKDNDEEAFAAKLPFEKKSCNYCKKKNHVEADCFMKKRHDKDRTNQPTQYAAQPKHQQQRAADTWAWQDAGREDNDHHASGNC